MPQIIVSPAPVLRIRKAVPAARMQNREAFGIFKYWLPVIICAATIFYFSSLPGPSIPKLFSFQEIVYHFFVYLLLGILFSRAMKSSTGLSSVRILIFTFIFAFFYGISDELHQYFVPNRNVSVFDVLLDGFGGLSGGSLYRWLK
jgi:VanZ family protein